MARIPTASQLGDVQPSNQRQVIRPDAAAFGAVGAAAQGMGQVVGRIGAQIADTQDKASEYELSKQFIQMDLDLDRRFDEAQRSAPENPQGFAQSLRKEYDEAAKGFFTRVPEQHRAKYDEMLARRAAMYERRALDFETKARDDYHVNDLSRNLSDLSTLSATKPESYREMIARGQTLVDSAPILASTRMELKQKFAQKAEGLAIRARIERGDDLDQIMTDLRGGPEPLDTDENPEVRSRPGGQPLGLIERGNINLNNRPKVKNSDGSISTVRSITVGIDGREIVVPTVSDDGRIMSDDEAVEQYRKTGKHLGIFDNAKNADTYASRLHEDQERLYLGNGSPRKRISSFAPAVNSAIEAAAEAEGVSADDMAVFARIESSGRPDAVTGSYRGLFQLSKSEFEKYGGGDIFNPADNARAQARKMKAEAAEFQAKYGKAPTTLDLYLVHQQGEGGYAAHVARPDAPAWQNMASTGEGRQKGARWSKQAIWGNVPDDMKARFGRVENVTSQQFMNVWKEKMGRMGGGSGEIDAGPAYSGPYRHLSADQRLDLLTAAKAKVRAGVEGAREHLKQQLDDDIESIRRTGVSSTPDLRMAQQVLEPNQLTRYRINRQEAEMEFRALNDLVSLPDSEIQKRLDEIEPKPGEEFFEMKAKVYDKANRAVSGENGIRTLRETDPARAVEEIKEVREATQFSRENPDDPEAIQRLAKARMDAQANVGVPDGLRKPITKTEARVIVSPLKGLEGKELREKGAEWLSGLQGKYGPYARAVAVDAIEMGITQDKDLAEEVEGLLSKTLKGQQPSAAAVRRMQFLDEVNAATQAFGGDFVGQPAQQYGTNARATAQPVPDAATPTQLYGMKQPPQAAVNLLLSNPALAPDFERKYGTGSAALIFAEQDQTTSEKKK